MNTLRMLADMTIELQQLGDLEAILHRASYYARAVLDGDDAGAIRARGRSGLSTTAATTPRADQAYELHITLGEGPCLDTLGKHVISSSIDLFEDRRWPAFGPAAAALGIHSMVCVPLASRERRCGALVVYADRRHAFTPADVEIVETLATHAAAALAAAERTTDLTLAVQSRTVIGQAQGILMQRFDIDAEAAFEFLRRISQDENKRLVAVAEAIVERRHR